MTTLQTDQLTEARDLIDQAGTRNEHRSHPGR